MGEQRAATARAASFRSPRALGLLAAIGAAALAAYAALGLRADREVDQRAQGSSPGRAPGVAASDGAATPSAGTRPLRVLFVGNSLTHTHDIPGMIAGLARAGGDAPLQAQVEAPGGFSLADHIGAGRVLSLLTPRRWDVVVLQEQGQRPGWTQRREHDFFASARALHHAASAAGARTVLYDTPARRAGDPEFLPGDSYEAMQTRIDEGYAMMGHELGATVVPVGRAYLQVLRTHPTIALWGDDGLHPSPAGAYLAACVFYARLYERSALGNAFLAGLPTDTARALQDVASWVGGSVPHRADQGPSAGADEPVVESVVSAARTPAGEARARDEALADRARHARVAADIRAREIRQRRGRIAVTMYKTSWCAACKRASAYMHDNGISVQELDVETDLEARTAARLLNPRGSVPTIEVGGAVLIGWNEARFDQLLQAAAATNAAR